MRTGYENIIPYRVGKMYAYMAEKDGKIISRNEHGVVVEYDDGVRVGVNLGNQFGKFENVYCKHEVVSDLNVGDKVLTGDPIAYNTQFFERDYLNPKSILLKTGSNIKVALIEGDHTFEDSSVISPKVGGLLKTTVTKARSIVVEFRQGVRKLLTEGSVTTPDTVLGYIEDEITNDTGLFGDDDIEVLKRLAGKSPKAKVNGVVDRIEVYYHGNKNDMSVSLRKIANTADKALEDRCKAVGEVVVTGRVDNEYRVGGTPLGPDMAEIRMYISSDDVAGVGDKAVFGHQLKTTIGEVADYDIISMDGTVLDGFFGGRSIQARIVHSATMEGTTALVMEVRSKQIANEYFGN